MSLTYTWLEDDNRNLQESACKFYKRLLVGIIRWYESDGSQLAVPDDFFYGISESDGFECRFEDLIDEDDDDKEKAFRLFLQSKEWVFRKDDCGHSVLEEDLEFSLTPIVERKTDKVHLKLVVDNE